MFLLHSLLWYSVLGLNVWDSHHALKPARAATKNRQARGILERKREVKAQLILWVVWILYVHIEVLADRTIAYVLPFDSIKMVILCWMLASRTFGALFVFNNLIAPTLSLYTIPLDLTFSLIYELSEAVLWLLALPYRRLRTALGLASSAEDQNAFNTRDETTLTPRTVVRRAKKVYEEIERLQKMERPLSRKVVEKDPRLRQRRMVLEKNAKEREEREEKALGEEIEEMAREVQARAQQGSPSSSSRGPPATDPQSQAAALKTTLLGTGPSSNPPVVVGGSSSSVRAGSFVRHAPIASSFTSFTSRLSTTRTSSSLHLSNQPTLTSSRPSSSASDPSTNAVASSSKISSPFLLSATSATTSLGTSSATWSSTTASSIAPLIDRTSTPSSSSSTPRAQPLPNASSFRPLPSTPLPPGAFVFVSRLLETVPQHPPSPSSPPSAGLTPRKRKVGSPPKPRATPARKAKIKAMLEIQSAVKKESKEDMILLEEREDVEKPKAEKELSASGKQKRRKLVFDEGESEGEGEAKNGKGTEMVPAKAAVPTVEEEEDEKEPTPSAPSIGQTTVKRARPPPVPSSTITRQPNAATTKAASTSLRRPPSTRSLATTSTSASTRPIRATSASASASAPTSSRTTRTTPVTVASHRTRIVYGGSEMEVAPAPARATATARGRGSSRGRGG